MRRNTHSTQLKNSQQNQERPKPPTGPRPNRSHIGDQVSSPKPESMVKVSQTAERFFTALHAVNINIEKSTDQQLLRMPVIGLLSDFDKMPENLQNEFLDHLQYYKFNEADIELLKKILKVDASLIKNSTDLTREKIDACLEKLSSSYAPNRKIKGISVCLKLIKEIFDFCDEHKTSKNKIAKLQFIEKINALEKMSKQSKKNFYKALMYKKFNLYHIKKLNDLFVDNDIKDYIKPAAEKFKIKINLFISPSEFYQTLFDPQLEHNAELQRKMVIILNNVSNLDIISRLNFLLDLKKYKITLDKCYLLDKVLKNQQEKVKELKMDNPGHFPVQLAFVCADVKTIRKRKNSTLFAETFYYELVQLVNCKDDAEKIKLTGEFKANLLAVMRLERKSDEMNFFLRLSQLALNQSHYELIEKTFTEIAIERPLNEIEKKNISLIKEIFHLLIIQQVAYAEVIANVEATANVVQKQVIKETVHQQSLWTEKDPVPRSKQHDDVAAPPREDDSILTRSMTI